VAGAECREASVFQGLRHLVRPRPEDLVIVHDGARPCLHPGDLQRVINSAREWGAALAVTPVRDTLKRVRNHEVAETVNRDNLVHALTPQIARYDWLKQAFDKAKDLSLFTDESGLLEAEGHQVRTVHLDHPNPKVTFSQDLHLAEVILSLHQRI